MSDPVGHDGAASRALAARVLAEMLAEGAPLADVLARRLTAGDDPPFVRELTYGTARHWYRLRDLVGARLKRPLKNRDRDLECLLLSGAYQLACLDVPGRACVHASVEAARQLGKGWASGLVNAVLRRLQRDAALRGLPDDPALPDAARHDHPDWLLAALRAQWPEAWPAIVAAGNARPPLTLRVNLARTSRAAYLDTLTACGFAARAGVLTPEAVYLKTPTSVEALPGFETGEVSVQDEGAQLAVRLIDPQPGERVLDACAAPGGKTAHLAERMPETRITALDPVAERLRRVSENLGRIGGTAQLITADARATAQWWDGEPFDRILVDAPCTATGILRRQPDIRVLRHSADVAKLSRIQLELLEQLFPLLRPGGRLVYATCSLLDDENAGVIEAFLEHRTGALAAPPAGRWGTPRGIAGRQMLPSADAHDGFYYACLERLPVH